MAIPTFATWRRCALLLILPVAPAKAADCNINPDRSLYEDCLQQAVEPTNVEVERPASNLIAGADEIRGRS